MVATWTCGVPSMKTCSGQAQRGAAQFPLVGSDGTVAADTFPFQDVQTSEPLMVEGPTIVRGFEIVADSRNTQFGRRSTEPVGALMMSV